MKKTFLIKANSRLKDEQKKKLASIKQAEDGLYEDFKRGLIDLDTLNFELEGFSLSRSLILNKPF